MEIIKSIDNQKIKYLTKLKNKKYRDKEGYFLVETIHLVEEAKKSGLLKEVYILENTQIDYDVPKYYISKSIMSKLSNLPSPSCVIGLVKKITPNPYHNRLLLLDNIQDPGNLGTMIRSAVAFNIDTLVLGNDCVDLYNDKVIRASEGMLFNLNIIRTNLLDFIKNLEKENYTIYGTAVVNGIDLKNTIFPKKCAVVIGNEGQGIKKEIRSLLPKNIYIPTSIKTESLNASVAASIIMYEMSSKNEK